MFKVGANHLHCLKQAPKYYSYLEHSPPLFNADDFEIRKSIGTGKSSFVFEAVDIFSKKVILKLKKPNAPQKLFLRQILVLTHLAGVQNISRLDKVLQLGRSGNPQGLILDHDQGVDLLNNNRFTSMTMKDLQNMLRDVLRSLCQMHKRGIIHRDVKLNNIIRTQRGYKLIDMGLAQFYLHEQPLSSRVGTRQFMAPELLLEQRLYDFSIDIWSLAVCAIHILRKDKLFQAREYNQLILQACQFFSQKEATPLFAHLGLTNRLRALKVRNKEANQLVGQVEDPSLRDLLLGMTRFCQRLTAEEALQHQFFRKDLT